MPRFPRSEAEIADLARHIIDGLERAPDDFPRPPVSPDELRAKLDEYSSVMTATVAAEAALRQQHARKDKVLADLKDAMKASLRYAEIMARDRPQKLTGLGWGKRRERTRLQRPGEVENIKIEGEGDTWVTLTWRKPSTGGEVAAYIIKRRRAKGRRWVTVATVMGETEHTLADQPRGEELEFVVVGKNRAGEGGPSRTVTAVL